MRQKDPMNLNGGGFRHVVVGITFWCRYKVSKLGRSIRKSKNNGALGGHLVGATALGKQKKLRIGLSGIKGKTSMKETAIYLSVVIGEYYRG